MNKNYILGSLTIILGPSLVPTLCVGTPGQRSAPT